MKLPRDISGGELTKKLKVFGYEVTRQSGSHLRLTTTKNGEHHVSIPNHDSLRVGTLVSILNTIAEHFHKTREEIINEIF